MRRSAQSHWLNSSLRFFPSSSLSSGTALSPSLVKPRFEKPPFVCSQLICPPSSVKTPFARHFVKLSLLSPSICQATLHPTFPPVLLPLLVAKHTYRAKRKSWALTLSA